MAESYDFSDIDIDLGGSDELGTSLGLDLSVKEVRSGSPAYGRIQPLDRIILINGEMVTSAVGLEDLVAKHRPYLNVRIFKPRPGYEYFYAHISLVHKETFGMILKDLNNRVFIGRVESGSLSYRAGVKDGDFVVHVHGEKVTTRDAAKKQIIKALKEYRCVSILLERAANENTRSVVRLAQQASRMQPPSVMMASDVHEIVAHEQARMRCNQDAATTNLLVPPGASDVNDQQHVRIATQHNTVAIRNDHPDKKLKHVTKSKK